ncbi:hypothetical protein SteCoe_23850 [Stentor coeruleus]|uniref:Uncharacterized protein n=1 Tax=Stentor coeruleus TaxID=5963 RepID=A0A1R2BIZ0_9CILI|nr:hypothetical protein SteCoe_23850 [Stentor coeruleus]
MINLSDSYCLWLMVSVHIIASFQIIYASIFKKQRHSQVFNINTKNENIKYTSSNDITFDDQNFMKFPKNSFSTYFQILLQNHLLLRSFSSRFSPCDSILEFLSQNIILIGILGISGTEYKAWDDINSVIAGFIAAIVARIFHFGYSALQVKQNKIPMEFSSEDKLVVAVESEVVRRLNVHRTMRRVFGYLIMGLYYTANVYYTIKLDLAFGQQENYRWFIAFWIGFAFLVFFIEPLKVYIQIAAVNYMKAGGPLESICKFVIGEEFINSYND